MHACVDQVLRIFGTQVTRKKTRLVRDVFPEYISVSYDYAIICVQNMILLLHKLGLYEKSQTQLHISVQLSGS